MPARLQGWRRWLPPLLGLLLLAAAVLPTSRWQEALIPTGTAGTRFNQGILQEIRLTLILAGLLGLATASRATPLWTRLLVLQSHADALDAWLQTGRRWQKLLLAMALLAGGLLALYSIRRHVQFNSKAYDLGLHAQVYWNTAQGRLFASSVEVSNYLGDHISPIILLLTPLYWLWPDPRTLLIVQALALATAALPLAWLARRRLARPWPQGAHLASLLLAAIYLSFPALGFANRFEFHEEALVLPLILLAFWFLELERPWTMGLALLLALLCKEDVGLSVAAFGVIAWWRYPRLRTHGLAWVVLALGWSVLALTVFIPTFRGAPSDTLGRYGWLVDAGQGSWQTLISLPGRVVRHLAGDPRRFWFLFKFLLPLGFLPLFSPVILAALPALLANWLADNLYQSSIYFHYALPILPFLFVAAIFGAERWAQGLSTDTLPRVRSRRTPSTATSAAANPPERTQGPAGSHGSGQGVPVLLMAWLIFCAILAGSFDQFWQREVGPTDWENYGLERQIDPAGFWAAKGLLPEKGSVATTEAYAPHLANREGLCLLHDPRILQVADQVDWVLVDLSDHRYGVQPKLYYGLLRWIADRRSLQVCYFADPVVLLGPSCGDSGASATYQDRLSELQLAASDEPIDPILMERLGARFFENSLP